MLPAGMLSADGLIAAGSDVAFQLDSLQQAPQNIGGQRQGFIYALRQVLQTPAPRTFRVPVSGRWPYLEIFLLSSV